jgi:hypothetical protein
MHAKKNLQIKKFHKFWSKKKKKRKTPELFLVSVDYYAAHRTNIDRYTDFWILCMWKIYDEKKTWIEQKRNTTSDV